MKNSSALNYQYFQFTVFADYGALRYLFFSLCLLLYMIIISANLIVILTICLEKSLHQPMFVFICCLCCNSMLGSTGFFPRFLLDLLSDSHWISRPSCFVQLYVIFMYVACELSILGVMAYDRFVAICQPLHYHSKMTFKMMLCLIFYAEFFPALGLAGHVFILSLFPVCSNKLPRLFCSSVSSLSCVDMTKSNTDGKAVTMSVIGIPLCFIVYSYLRILIVCRRSSTEFKGKALQTCLPHLLTFLTFIVTLSCELLLKTLESVQLNPIITAVLSLEYLIIPPINNPLVYGMTLPQIRRFIFSFFKIGKVGPVSKMLKVTK